MTLFAETLSVGIADWTLTYLLHSTLLIGTVWLLTRLLPLAWLDVQEIFWKCSLVLPLVTATAVVGWQASLWDVSLPWLAASAAQADAVDPPEHDKLTAAESSRAMALDADLNRFEFAVEEPLTAPTENDRRPAVAAAKTIPVETEETVPAGDQVSDNAQPSTHVPLASAAATGIAWKQWAGGLLAIWFVLSTAAIGGFVALWVAFWRLTSDRRSLSGGPLYDQLRRLLDNSGFGRHVELNCSDRLTRPAALGVFRLQICVPKRALNDLDGPQQRAMLAHELAHLVRRDPLWMLAARTLEIVLLFQPLNCLVRIRLQQIAEFQCDAWAAAQTGEGISLAKCLAEVATWLASPQPAGVLGMAHRRSGLRQRIERLLAPVGGAGRAATWSIVLLPAVLLAALFLIPGIRLTSAEVAAPHNKPDELEEHSDESRWPPHHDHNEHSRDMHPGAFARQDGQGDFRPRGFGSPEGRHDIRRRDYDLRSRPVHPPHEMIEAAAESIATLDEELALLEENLQAMEKIIDRWEQPDKVVVEHIRRLRNRFSEIMSRRRELEQMLHASRPPAERDQE